MCTFKSDPGWTWLMVPSWNIYINKRLSQIVGRMESPNRIRIQVRKMGDKVPTFNPQVVVVGEEGR